MSGFRFKVEKTFTVPGRGVVVSGKVEEGKVAVEQVIGFLETTGQWKNVVVVAIEVEQRLVEEAQAGQRASLLLDGVKKKQIPYRELFFLERLKDPFPKRHISRNPRLNQAAGPPRRRLRNSYPDPYSLRPAYSPDLRLLAPCGFGVGGTLHYSADLVFPGKTGSAERRVEIHPDPGGTMARFLHAGDDLTLRQAAGVMFFPAHFSFGASRSGPRAPTEAVT